MPKCWIFVWLTSECHWVVDFFCIWGKYSTYIPVTVYIWENITKRNRDFYSFIWLCLNREKSMESSHCCLLSHNLTSRHFWDSLMMLEKRNSRIPMITKTLGERKKTPVLNPHSSYFWLCLEFPKTFLKKGEDEIYFPKIMIVSLALIL